MKDVELGVLQERFADPGSGRIQTVPEEGSQMDNLFTCGAVK